ncbi:MAG: hypothetical protein JXA20_03530 [Spirochaetes bacterium]|nr:hypothetical protein [Spirochaetota bacterium]
MPCKDRNGTRNGGIGLLNEHTIHNQLKAAYAGRNDRTEQVLDGYVIDIVKKTGLVEIQTGNFLRIKTKLHRLLRTHNVRLVHNIPSIKWIVTTDDAGNALSRRRSPKMGKAYHLFDELIYLAGIVPHPNFSLEIVMTEEEEIRRNDGRGSWRRKGKSIRDRRLVRILEKMKFNRPGDYLKILPRGMKQPFSSREVAAALGIGEDLARRILYFFRKAHLVEPAGKEGNLLLYSIHN